MLLIITQVRHHLSRQLCLLALALGLCCLISPPARAETFSPATRAEPAALSNRPGHTPGPGLTPPLPILSRRPYLLALVLGLCLILYSASCLAPTPMLRIQTGMHTATIWRIATDAQGRWLVTASEDKTARVWELPSGRLLRTLRPPIGAGHEGKLYAVALTPDGNTIALGGFTGKAKEEQIIYFFDRVSGRLRHRLTGLPEVVNHLAYSRDGRWLVAALGGQHGVRVYAATEGYALVYSDTEYGHSCYGADFDAAGRFAASCRDGQLRLYGHDTANRWQRLAQQPAPHGKLPYTVSFTADGERLAVGYQDTGHVSVVSGRTLKPLFAPDTRGVENGNLGNVAWATDGRTLYAGGTWRRDGAFPLRRWEAGGRGPARDTETAARNTIQHLAALPAGASLLYGTAEPSWGLLYESGAQRLAAAAAQADFRDNRGGFCVSEDGSEVAFGYGPGGQSSAQFDLETKHLAWGVRRAGLAAPLTQGPGLPVTNWQDTYAPRLNGEALPWARHECARSLARTPDGSAFLLGTEWNLRLYGGDGRECWRQALPGAAWAVNLSGDGRLALAAVGDGTIRWYRISDGAELLAFFPHGDKKRWVLWTPAGYYDCAPGAEELIGWHINNGPGQEAGFYPAHLFREQFYRPDVVAQALSAPGAATPPSGADQETGRCVRTSLMGDRPPVVTILSPRDQARLDYTAVAVHYRVRTPPQAPVTRLRAFIDGRLADTSCGGVPRLKDTLAIVVNVPARACTLTLQAENKYGAGNPATIRLAWRNQPAAETKPKLYVLAVGVSRYADAGLNLGYPAKDAQDFVNALQPQQGGLYREVEAKVLTDAQATKDEILDGLEWLRQETTARDVAVVFLAGHGFNDTRNRYFFGTHNINTGKVLRTGITNADLRFAGEAIAGKTVFFLDTCYSGNAHKDSARCARAHNVTGLLDELGRAANGVTVFAASTGQQISLENAAWDNGAFTVALLEFLSGKIKTRISAGNKELLHTLRRCGNLTIAMLELYLSERVKELTGGSQTPATRKPDGAPDFPFVLGV